MDGNEVRSVAATFVTDTTNPPAPRPRWLRRGRFDLVEIADVITALICFAITNSTLSNPDVGHPGYHAPGLLLLLAFLTCAPLALRTRFPLAAWAASTLAIIGTSRVVLVGASGYLLVALLVNSLCLYAVAVRCRPRIVVAAAVVTVFGAGFLKPGAVPEAVLLAVSPLLIGAVVRQRRSGARQLAEQERRHSGERALLEERQRIARELHDVVAHHMSVSAIQAEAAPYKTPAPPPELVESFADIRASALAGLSELRRVLGVLRTGQQSTAPQPGLADLDALLDSARSGGVSVTVTHGGSPVTLPEGVDLSAYRIVQEALSNAMRHAPGSHVQLHLTYRPDALALEISNDAALRAVPVLAGSGDRAAGGGGGHGLVGMRERTTMLGGSLDAGPTADGGFRVAAVLPVTPPEEAA
ncbi:MAG TPA: histidine kinase [Streptosporangiaceae bacterium]|nr:histidine kinase [Streptosporangiaceae bacterium]